MSLTSPKFQDRIFCSLFYTGLFVPFMSLVPFVWIIVANVRKQYLPEYFKYHCYQAILFNMIASFLPHAVSLLIDFTCNLLDLMVIFGNTIVLLKQLNGWFLWAYAIFIKLAVLYAFIWTFRGKYTYMPPLSQAVNLMLR